MFFKRRDSIEAMRDQAARKLYDPAHYKLDCKARAGDVNAAVTMARYWLGEAPKKDIQIALGFLREPARAGNKDARAMVAMALLDGINDVGHSFSLWVSMMPFRLGVRRQLDRWMVDEANAGGNALRVLVCLADMHWGNAGAKMAAHGRLLEYAWEGSPPAAAATGWSFWHGEGTPANIETAYVWFSVARTLGVKSVDDDMETIARKLPSDRLLIAQKGAGKTFEAILSGRPRDRQLRPERG